MDAVKTAVEVKPAPALKTFEICFAQEPTQEQMSLIYREGCSWQMIRVIKGYPRNFRKEKTDEGYWVVKFDVFADDWLFWCGYAAGKKLGMNIGKDGDLHKWYCEKTKQIYNPEYGFYQGGYGY